ncbi:MAG: hypothetical protein MI863_21380 [Desulfobacterales bacterium]|nr:hypothetical protein [Desulfobacterales bacterium]
MKIQNKRPVRRALLILLIWGVTWCNTALPAGNTAPAGPETEWDGHIKVYTRVVFPRSGTAHEAAGLSPNTDGFGEFRLNNKTFFNDTAYTEVHYEALAGGGGTRKDGEEIKTIYPDLFPDGLFGPPNDDRRLFDLTRVIHEDKETMSYHRLDRAMVAFTPSWGEIRLGRQAVTWGNGFTFNPMDLFNPFAPTDLERDYKMGDDLALIRFPVKTADVEIIYVARRDPDTGDMGMDENSLGTKLHFFAGETEMDLMVTRHYEDMIAGMGAAGYLGGTAWRLDLTGTFLKEESRGRRAYASAVANMDYSWVWIGKNWYGYIEFYYNGLSDADYSDHFSDLAVSRRIARGELFALGRFYASANLNLEVHPLVNAYATPILNLNDGSGLFLPRVVYDYADNIRLTVTGALHWGGSNTEYGGYDIPGASFDYKPSDSISAWATWYF